jgi:4-hydroxy-tetrahydrodipicolinate synthase
MTVEDRFSGVLAPVVTPFAADLAPDADRLVRHCRWLLSQNCGLAVFGTNSEANSLSVDEKIALLDRLAGDGIDAARMMPGTGCCALTDTVRLTAHAVALGCAGVLMLPPFYYKGVSDDGLYRSFAEVIERVGDARLRIYLYHIPPIAQVPISLDLIERLVRDYPATVVGIKDSSGEWDNTAAMLARGWPDFRIFVGSESFLLANMKDGGAGCISATANVNPAAIHELYANWRSPNAARMQTGLDDIRDTVARFPMIPALKAIVAHYSNDAAWTTVRPPLVALGRAQRDAAIAAIEAQGFSMPGLVETVA